MSSDEQEIRIRRLEPSDDRSKFRCGNIDLDRFFQRYAGQNQFHHHIGTTYVAIREEEQITGFVTVTSGEMSVEKLPKILRKHLPSYPLPILRIARLAVDERFQGHGVGRLLLRAMLKLALELRDWTGCTGVVVDAKPEAVAFYSSLGFKSIDILCGELGDRPEPLTMFLTMRQIELATGETGGSAG